MDAYPRLKGADIQAVMAYAADTVAHEQIVVIKEDGFRKRKKR